MFHSNLFFSFNSYSPSQFNWKGNGQRDRQTDRCYYSAIDITKHFKQVLVQHLLIWLFFSLFFLTHPTSDGTSIKSSSISFLLLLFDKKEAQKLWSRLLKSYQFSKVTQKKKSLTKRYYVSQWPREKKWFRLEKIDKNT